MKTAAERDKAYRERKKAAASQIKPPPKTTSERVQAYRDRVRATTLHRPSTSALDPQSTNKVNPPSTTSPHQQSISGPKLPCTTALNLPVPLKTINGRVKPCKTDQLHPPSITRPIQPSTSAANQQSTSALGPPSISALHQPFSGPLHQPSTCNLSRPSTSILKAMSLLRRLSGTPSHRPLKTIVKAISTSSLHRPSLTPSHRPLKTILKVTSTSPIHLPSSTPSHEPSITVLDRPPTSALKAQSTNIVNPQSTNNINPPSTTSLHQQSISGPQLPCTTALNLPVVPYVQHTPTFAAHPVVLQTNHQVVLQTVHQVVLQTAHHVVLQTEQANNSRIMIDIGSQTDDVETVSKGKLERECTSPVTVNCPHKELLMHSIIEIADLKDTIANLKEMISKLTRYQSQNIPEAQEQASVTQISTPAAIPVSMLHAKEVSVPTWFEQSETQQTAPINDTRFNTFNPYEEIRPKQEPPDVEYMSEDEENTPDACEEEREIEAVVEQEPDVVQYNTFGDCVVAIDELDPKTRFYSIACRTLDNGETQSLSEALETARENAEKDTAARSEPKTGSNNNETEKLAIITHPMVLRQRSVTFT